MGELAEILRSNLRELAQAEASEIREIDAALKASRAVDETLGSENKNPKKNSLKAREDLKALNQVQEVKAILSSGDFMSQNKEVLISLCRKNKLSRYSKLNKSRLASLLEENGVKPPLPKPAAKRTKKELANLVEKIEKLVGL